jgi:hypothetical protein
MGTWGYGNFDNDGAIDWLEDFVDNPKPKSVDIAFKKILDAAKFINLDDSEHALAAAELVAGLNKKPSLDLPESARLFLERYNIMATPELKEMAAKVVARIRDKSEIKELWTESGDLDPWLEVVDDLLERLA